MHKPTRAPLFLTVRIDRTNPCQPYLNPTTTKMRRPPSGIGGLLIGGARHKIIRLVARETP